MGRTDGQTYRRGGLYHSHHFDLAGANRPGGRGEKVNSSGTYSVDARHTWFAEESCRG